MLNLTATKAVGNNVSGLNLSKEAHDKINDCLTMLKEAGLEIRDRKNNKKELFEAGADLLYETLVETIQKMKEAKETSAV